MGSRKAAGSRTGSIQCSRAVLGQNPAQPHSTTVRTQRSRVAPLLRRAAPASSLPASGTQMCVQTEPASCCTSSTCLTYKDNKNSMPAQLTSRSNIQPQHNLPGRRTWHAHRQPSALTAAVHLPVTPPLQTMKLQSTTALVGMWRTASKYYLKLLKY